MSDFYVERDCQNIQTSKDVNGFWDFFKSFLKGRGGKRVFRGLQTPAEPVFMGLGGFFDFQVGRVKIFGVCGGIFGRGCVFGRFFGPISRKRKRGEEAEESGKIPTLSSQYQCVTKLFQLNCASWADGKGRKSAILAA